MRERVWKLTIFYILFGVLLALPTDYSHATDMDGTSIYREIQQRELSELVSNKPVGKSLFSMFQQKLSDMLRQRLEESGISSFEELVDISKYVFLKENSIPLRIGIYSDQVPVLRAFYESIGYEVTGSGYAFDDNLHKLTITFQKENNIEVDGVVGPQTTSVINRRIKIGRIIVPGIRLGLSNNTFSNSTIIINKTSNTLYHIENNKVLDSYPLGTGKTMSHTPEGKFTIVTKLVNPYWGGAGRYTPVKGGALNNPLGKRWMGLSYGGGTSYGIHGTSDESSIGKYVSLGCVRMLNRDAEYLFDRISKGTPVWIGQEKLLSNWGIEFSYTNRLSMVVVE